MTKPNNNIILRTKAFQVSIYYRYILLGKHLALCRKDKFCYCLYPTGCLTVYSHRITEWLIVFKFPSVPVGSAQHPFQSSAVGSYAELRLIYKKTATDSSQQDCSSQSPDKITPADNRDSASFKCSMSKILLQEILQGSSISGLILALTGEVGFISLLYSQCHYLHELRTIAGCAAFAD